MAPPSPQELEGHNAKLEQFDEEMRAKGLQMPASEEPGRFQIDERTGIRVDTAALERCHELYGAMDTAERDAARGEYQETLAEIYAGRLGLADMEDVPGTEQPRSAPSQYTPDQWEAGHASVADEAGFIPLEQINPEGLSGYTLPRLAEGQTYHKGIFADLAAARAIGVTQEQVNAFIEAQMRRDGIIQ